jgi:hypothetical protein
MAASDHASAGWASAVFATTLGQQLAWESIWHLCWPPLQVNAVLAFQVLKPNARTTLASPLVFNHDRWF